MSTESNRTEAQAEASRTNGAKSQGPVTPEGKERSSQNAIKHGLYSSRVLLPNEDPEQYKTLLERYIAEWRPVGQTESDLLLRMVNTKWRLDRIEAQAAAMEANEMALQWKEFNSSFDPTDPVKRQADAVVCVAMAAPSALDYFTRAEKRLDAMYHSARKALIEQIQMRTGQLPKLVPQPALALPQEDATGNEPSITGNHALDPENYDLFSIFHRTKIRRTSARRDWLNPAFTPPEDKAA